MTALRLAHRLLLASAALAIVAPELAIAQQQPVDPNTTVADRARPEFDPIGIRAGSFLAFPELAVTGLYSDNVGFDEDDEDSDFGTIIRPSVEFQSQWARHNLAVEIGSEVAIYAEESDEDFQDVFLIGNGTIDVTRQTTIDTTAEARLSHEERDDPEEDSGDDLEEIYEFGGGAAINHQINRLGFTAGVDLSRAIYEDDDDRDANFYEFLLRSSYEVSPRLDLFVEGVFDIEDRDDDVDDNGIERDTEGYEVRAGAGLDITAVLFGEAFVGYRLQTFEEDDFDNEEGVSFGADLNWNPSLLTSVGLSGSRDFVSTDQGDAASNFRTEIGLTIDHELLRNLVVNGEASYQLDEFRGDDREDDTFTLGGGLTYWLNRNLSINGGYQFSERDSNEAGEDFTVNEFSIGLTARL